MHFKLEKGMLILLFEYAFMYPNKSFHPIALQNSFKLLIMQCIILFKVDINCVRDVVCQRRLKSITQSKFVKQICSHIILKYYLLVSSYIK